MKHDDPMQHMTLSLEPMQQRERESKRNPTRSEYNAYTAWTKKKYAEPVTQRATEAPVTPRFITHDSSIIVSEDK
jgi:hypothetical protein